MPIPHNITSLAPNRMIVPGVYVRDFHTYYTQPYPSDSNNLLYPPRPGPPMYRVTIDIDPSLASVDGHYLMVNSNAIIPPQPSPPLPMLPAATPSVTVTWEDAAQQFGGTIQPCPFCDHRHPVLHISRSTCNVHCPSCGADGPTFFEPDRAIIKWNERP